MVCCIRAIAHSARLVRARVLKLKTGVKWGTPKPRARLVRARVLKHHWHFYRPNNLSARLVRARVLKQRFGL